MQAQTRSHFITNEKRKSNNKTNFGEKTTNGENSLSTTVGTSHLSGYSSMTEM
jgi:hypothetical protein